MQNCYLTHSLVVTAVRLSIPRARNRKPLSSPIGSICGGGGGGDPHLSIELHREIPHTQREIPLSSPLFTGISASVGNQSISIHSDLYRLALTLNCSRCGHMWRYWPLLSPSHLDGIQKAPIWLPFGSQLFRLFAHCPDCDLFGR